MAVPDNRNPLEVGRDDDLDVMTHAAGEAHPVRAAEGAGIPSKQIPAPPVDPVLPQPASASRQAPGVSRIFPYRPYGP